MVTWFCEKGMSSEDPLTEQQSNDQKLDTRHRKMVHQVTIKTIPRLSIDRETAWGGKPSWKGSKTTTTQETDENIQTWGENWCTLNLEWKTLLGRRSPTFNAWSIKIVVLPTGISESAYSYHLGKPRACSF